MILNFDKNGCLFHGIYELSLDEVEETFVKDKSQRRREIFDYYKYHITKIKETDCCLNHWINGSFVTLKENPNDIDTLTEFDGVKINNLGIQYIVDDLIFNAPLRTGGCCHSFVVYKFPEYYKKDYEEYIFSKMKILYLLFPINIEHGNLKGLYT